MNIFQEPLLLICFKTITNNDFKIDALIEHGTVTLVTLQFFDTVGYAPMAFGLHKYLVPFSNTATLKTVEKEN